MKYKIYYGGYKVKIPGYYLEFTKQRHIWPEDTTELALTIEDDILHYEISNLSDRTQYLYENDLLGLGLFVEENPSWISKKNWWRSEEAKERHLTRRCIKVYRIDSLSGEIDLNSIDMFARSGCLSKQMYYVFNYSASYQDPFVSNGTENVAIGIGKMYDTDENSGMVSCFRPHKISDYEQITVYNKLE